MKKTMTFLVIVGLMYVGFEPSQGLALEELTLDEASAISVSAECCTTRRDDIAENEVCRNFEPVTKCDGFLDTPDTCNAREKKTACTSHKNKGTTSGTKDVIENPATDCAGTYTVTPCKCTDQKWIPGFGTRCLKCSEQTPKAPVACPTKAKITFSTGCITN